MSELKALAKLLEIPFGSKIRKDQLYKDDYSIFENRDGE